MKKSKKIVVIGGGTGTYSVLSGLRKFKNLKLSVVVTMMDSGGSNRVIRDEFGLLPTSDIRQCMVALTPENTSEQLRELFTYRYSSGTGIAGMTFGNLFMAALTDIYKNQEEAIEKTCELLNVQGNIYPVTFDDVHLVAKYDNGKEVLGEHLINEPDKSLGDTKIAGLKLSPKASANKKALAAIKEADMIIMGPGDLFTSVICNLVVGGVSEAIRGSKAEKVYIVNLMTKFGETTNFSASEHLATLEKYLGTKINVCLVNKSTKFPEGVLERYGQEKAYPVKDDLKEGSGLKVVRGDFVSGAVYKQKESDKVKRSLIRHDSKKLAKALVELL